MVTAIAHHPWKTKFLAKLTQQKHTTSSVAHMDEYCAITHSVSGSKWYGPLAPIQKTDDLRLDELQLAHGDLLAKMTNLPEQFSFWIVYVSGELTC